MDKVISTIYKAISDKLNKIIGKPNKDNLAAQGDIQELIKSFEKANDRIKKKLNSLFEIKFIQEASRYIRKKIHISITAVIADEQMNEIFSRVEMATQLLKEKINGELINAIKVDIIEPYIDCLEEMQQLEKNISFYRDRVKFIIQKRALNISYTQRKDKFELKSYIQPSIYNTRFSNLLPTNSDIFDPSTLVLRGPIKIKECISRRWIHPSQPKCIKNHSNSLEKILPVEKSKIKIEFLEVEPFLNDHCHKYGKSIQICDVRKQIDDSFTLELMYNKEQFKQLIESHSIKMSNFDSERLKSEKMSFENICLNSIFMYSSSEKYANKQMDNIVLKNEFYKPNLLVNNLAFQAKLLPENFLLFLFIEGGLPKDRQQTSNQFFQEVEFYENLKRSECHDEKKLMDRIINVYLPLKNLSIGAIKKLMMLVAEELNISRFYIINDDIQKFREFEKCQGGTRKYFDHEKSSARALAFMNMVLDSGIAGQDNAEKSNTDASLESQEIGKKFMDSISEIVYDFLKKSENLRLSKSTNKTAFLNILSELNIKQRFSEDANNEICSLEKKIEFFKNEMKIKGPNSQTLGQVSLKNGKRVSLDHLEKIKPTTHFISKLDRNELVLYNQEAIRGN
jgi:hypothetical protein